MRTFEILVAGLVCAAGVWSLVAGVRSKTFLYFIFFLGLLAFFLHLWLEGAHWQMAPAYLGLLVLAGLLLLKNPAGVTMSAGGWLMLFLVFFSACLSATLPMFRLPQVTGPFPVGTRSIFLIDSTRMEDAAPGSGRKRELMIQIWYPAESSKNPLAPYRTRKETTLVSSYQSVLWTHSRLNAPVAKGSGSFPVLLFSPGWTGRRTELTYLAEELASHGFVVAGIDHTYNSGPVAFPDGRVLQAAPDTWIDFQADSLESIEAKLNKELIKQTADTIFVLDSLQAMNADRASPFYQRLASRTSGAFGFSFGGAVAAQASYLDPRIRAALDLDGSLFGEVQREGLHKPFMFISEVPAQFPPDAHLTHGQLIDQAMDAGDAAMFEKSGGYRIFLPGSTHKSFTDSALFSPFDSLSGAGQIPPRRQYSIIRAYALAFFDKSLKGKSSSLLDVLDADKSPFPEVRVQTKAAVGR
jgi:dienelactone hydrolase